MGDDRLLRHQDDLLSVLYEEAGVAHALPPLVWVRLSAMIGEECHPEVLRSECLNALHVAMAYAYDKVFRPLTEYPWKLVVGDIAQNLLVLAALPGPPPEDNAQKLWTLLQAGHSHGPLIQALTLVRDVPFSTINVEQAHGSSATVQRFHPTLDLDMHMQRAFLHQSRHLFTESDEAKQQRRLEAKVQKLRRASKRTLSGRHVFFKTLAEAAARRHGPGALSTEDRKAIMSVHTRLYQLLQPEERMALQREARLLTEKKREATEEEVEGLMHAHRLGAARGSTLLQEQGLTNFASHQKLRADQLEKLEDKLQACSHWTRNELQKARATAQKPPEPPPVEVMQQLLDMEDHIVKAPKAEPEMWTKVLCEHRDDLQGLVVGTSFEMDAIVHRFLYASQNPRRAVFQVLRCLTWQAGAAKAEGQGSLTEYIDQCRPRLFEVCIGAYSSHLDLILDEDQDSLFAIPVSVYVEESLVAGLCTERPLGHVLAAYPHKHRRREGTQAPRHAAGSAAVPDAQMLSEHPWLQDYMQASSAKKARKVATSSGVLPDTQREVPPLTETQVAEAWEELAALRDSWSATHQARPADFQTCLRGGAWTKQHKDVVADAVSAAASSTESKNWLLRTDGSRMVSFSTLKYGQEAATLMASETPVLFQSLAGEGRAWQLLLHSGEHCSL